MWPARWSVPSWASCWATVSSARWRPPWKRAEQDSRIYESVKTALLACLRGYNPKIALEFARKTLPSNVRPAFSDFEQHLKTVK